VPNLGIDDVYGGFNLFHVFDGVSCARSHGACLLMSFNHCIVYTLI